MKTRMSKLILMLIIFILPRPATAAEKIKIGPAEFEISKKSENGLGACINEVAPKVSYKFAQLGQQEEERATRATKRGERETTERERKRIQRRRIRKEMIRIPAGEFMMGSPSAGGDADEHPQHKAYVDSFHLDKHAVTNTLFKAFVDATGYVTDAETKGWGYVWNGSNWWSNTDGATWRNPQGPNSGIDEIMDHPVVQVSWNDAQAYAQWAGKRLPTEAEWEYACRAGTTTKYNVGDSMTHNGANYEDVGERDMWRRTAPVGSFARNVWGLYDMHGNVWEWCQDWYGRDYYSNSPAKTPKGPRSGQARVVRGGSWGSNADSIRSAYRFYCAPLGRNDSLGFRCAKDIE